LDPVQVGRVLQYAREIDQVLEMDLEEDHDREDDPDLDQEVVVDPVQELDLDLCMGVADLEMGGFVPVGPRESR
jgi:hypothetical protein